MSEMEAVEAHLSLLGETVEDVITGRVGVVDSVCFDLYGCVQAVIRQKAKEDGSTPEGAWVDVKRLRVMGARVMEAPFVRPVGQENGPADKPDAARLPAR